MIYFSAGFTVHSWCCGRHHLLLHCVVHGEQKNTLHSSQNRGRWGNSFLPSHFLRMWGPHSMESTFFFALLKGVLQSQIICARKETWRNPKCSLWPTKALISGVGFYPCHTLYKCFFHFVAFLIFSPLFSEFIYLHHLFVCLSVCLSYY